MNMHFTNKISISEQIENKIIFYISNGVLKEGEKLPSVRELAISFNVNPNTVMKAYASLEEKGYIYSVYKKGFFVKKETKMKTVNEIKIEIKKLLEKYELTSDELVNILMEDQDDTN